jgi:hypothetical protein
MDFKVFLFKKFGLAVKDRIRNQACGFGSGVSGFESGVFEFGSGVSGIGSGVS